MAFYSGVDTKFTHYEVSVSNLELTKKRTIDLPSGVQYAWPHPTHKFLYVSSSNGGPGQSSGDHYPTAAIKLLLLTGARRGEILGLQWQNVDLSRKCLRLPDSKTGAKVIFLNDAALEILRSLPRLSNNLHVIPGTLIGRPFVSLDKIWHRVRASAGLRDVRLHDLRHSFASVAVSGGLSLPIIGALLGHKHAATTARYAHLAAAPLRAANDAVGARITAAMQFNLVQEAPKRSA